jgi:hypothetical protein
MFRVAKLISLMGAIIALLGVALGQETTGAIEGTVKDPQGGVVPGVTVTITSKAGGTEGNLSVAFRRTLTTDQNGFFRALEVPPGVYTITTEPKSGFAAATVDNVQVILGKTTPVTITLQTGGVQASVTVTSEVGAIDPTDNKIQTNITAQIADLLPKGTNFTSLLQVAPAVRAEPLAGGFQVDGASGSENTFIVDGQEVTNFRTGVLNANFNLPFQLVQEMQVKSSGFEAEYGGALGGVINVVTRGGTNELHGEFGAQFQPAKLQAGPRAFLREFRTGSVSAGNFVAIPEYIRPQRDGGTNEFFFGTLGGPIVKDRLWFLTSYSPQYYNTVRDLSYITSDPRSRRVTQTSIYRQQQVNYYGLARLDAAITDKLRASGSFTWSPIAQKGVLPAYTDALGAPPQAIIGNQTLVGPDFLRQQGGRQNANDVTGKVDWTPTSKLVVSLRAGRSFLNEKLNSYGIPRQTRYVCNAASSASLAALGGCTPGFQNFASNFQIDYDVSIRKTFDADASYYVSSFAGRHQFKFGYQYNGISNNVSEGYIDQGVVVLYYGLTIDNLTGQTPTPGAIGSGYLQRFGTRGKASSDNQAVFVQDSWQPFSRLTLNLGFRAERETVPSFNPGNPGITFGWKDKPAPRIGFAYDLTGDGKTKIFGFYGWFYDRFKYELPRGSFGGDFYRRDYFEIFPSNPQYTYYTVARILGNNQDVPGGRCPITNSTGLSICQYDFRIPSNQVGGSIYEGGAVDPNLKAQRQSEFTVGFERELGSPNSFLGTFVFSSRYTHKQIDRAIEDVGIPTPEGSEAYIIGNPGMGLAAQIAQQFGYPTIKAIRKYDALELRVDKRLSRHYYFNANYTYSRLYGNYPGLANSFEAGRTSPNVNRLFDLPFAAYTLNGEPALGRLPTDRPHVFKFYGSYEHSWSGSNSTDFSVYTTAQSGTPLTTVITLYNLNPTFVYGLGDLGRTEAFTQTDFAIRHRYRFGSDQRYTLVLDLDILNLFNESNELGRQTTLSPTNITGSALKIGDEVQTIRRIFNGGIRDSVLNYINASADRKYSTYNLTNSFQGPRSVRFGFRLEF